MNNLNDCYRYLGVDYNTSFEDVQKKYKAKAKELHPDLNPNDDSTEQFQELNNCFNLIKNNYLKYKASNEEIECENGFKIVVGFGDEEVDINKYKKDLSKLSCGCPDWLEKRSNFSINDPRRLCKHLIASFEKKDSVLNIESMNVESLLKNYQSMIKIPNELLQYSDAIYSFFDEKKGFDLYWHNDKYET
ncbi:MAG: DnaJ domain-containing protein, partial [Arcobacteraceae bacterium]